MPVVDPSVLKQLQEGSTIQEVYSADGKMVLGYKGRFCKHPSGEPMVFDNFTEALRENAKVNRIETLKAQGKNEHGQTPEQVKLFEQKQKHQKNAREKADLALAAAAGEMRR